MSDTESTELIEEPYIYRWGHEVVAIPNINTPVPLETPEVLDTLLIIGGVHKSYATNQFNNDQILVKTLPTVTVSGNLNRVEIVSRSGSIPPVFGHACKYIKDLYQIACIGGFDTVSDVYLARSLYGVLIFDLRKKMWLSTSVDELRYETGEAVPEVGIAEARAEVIRPGADRLPVLVVIGGRSQCYHCAGDAKDNLRPRSKGKIRYKDMSKSAAILNIAFEPASGVYGHCTVSDGVFIYTLFGSIPTKGSAPLIRRFEVRASNEYPGYGLTDLEYVPTTGPYPKPRAYPSCFIYYNQIYVFGGVEINKPSYSPTAASYDDLWRLDLQKMQWYNLNGPQTPGPGARWKSGSAVISLTRVSARQGRDTDINQTRRSEIFGMTGMVLHGGLTSGSVSNDDPKFYFIKNAAYGGWRELSIRDPRVLKYAQNRLGSNADSDAARNNTRYITALIILSLLILALCLIYVIRNVYPAMRRKHKDSSVKTNSSSKEKGNGHRYSMKESSDNFDPSQTKKDLTCSTGTAFSSKGDISLPRGNFVRKGGSRSLFRFSEIAGDYATSSPNRRSDIFNEISISSMPSVIGNRHRSFLQSEFKPPGRKSNNTEGDINLKNPSYIPPKTRTFPKFKLFRSLSGNFSPRKTRRESSINWMQNEFKENFPNLAADNMLEPGFTEASQHIIQTPSQGEELSKSSLLSSTSLLSPSNLVDFSKAYVTVQSFVSQRYDEVSLSTGDLCTLRVLFKDNWAVGINLMSKKSGIIPVACLRLHNSKSFHIPTGIPPSAYLETNVNEGIASSVKLEIQKNLKDLDQLFESGAITLDQYFSKRKNIFINCFVFD